MFLLFFFNDTATTEIYTLSLHDALPIWRGRSAWWRRGRAAGRPPARPAPAYPASPWAGRAGRPSAPPAGAGRPGGSGRRSTDPESTPLEFRHAHNSDGRLFL